ncbi:MAG: sigma-70 family RNA polymerase sigma factor [Romboutsia sp.]
MDAYLQAVEKGLKNITSLKEPEYFKTWFLRIVINESKNIINRNKNTVNIEDYYHKEIYEAIDKETKLDLERALENINEDVREMIRMKFYIGYSLEEISEILNVPIGTVKGKMYKAIKNMRKDLEVIDYERR